MSFWIDKVTILMVSIISWLVYKVQKLKLIASSNTPNRPSFVFSGLQFLLNFLPFSSDNSL